MRHWIPKTLSQRFRGREEQFLACPTHGITHAVVWQDDKPYCPKCGAQMRDEYEIAFRRGKEARK